MKGNDLGGFVRSRREELGLHQGELARRAGITQASLSNVELGRTRLPTPDHRRRLATALGVGHADLLLAAGEVAPDELEAWARGAGFVRAGDDEWWGAGLVARLRREQSEWARARLATEALRLTLEEAVWVLRLVEDMPTEGAAQRRSRPEEEYIAWRNGRDAALRL